MSDTTTPAAVPDDPTSDAGNETAADKLEMAETAKLVQADVVLTGMLIELRLGIFDTNDTDACSALQAATAPLIASIRAALPTPLAEQLDEVLAPLERLGGLAGVRIRQATAIAFADGVLNNLRNFGPQMLAVALGVAPALEGMTLGEPAGPGHSVGPDTGPSAYL